MNDRELLELAAKATEYSIDQRASFRTWREYSKLACLNVQGGHTLWNPLTDDGDALRLAVKCDIDIEREGETIVAWYSAPRPGWDNGQVGSWSEPLGEDPYAATRRAIVRAAAEIGKTKQ